MKQIKINKNSFSPNDYSNFLEKYNDWSNTKDINKKNKIVKDFNDAWNNSFRKNN